MAVLYRAHFQSLEIQMELTARGIPFLITSGLRFFEQAHIKDVAAFMRFVVNRKDEVSFLRMVSLLPRCGPGTAAKLWNEWLLTGLSGNENPPEEKWLLSPHPERPAGNAGFTTDISRLLRTHSTVGFNLPNIEIQGLAPFSFLQTQEPEFSLKTFDFRK
jgi:hypothetical protein